MPALSDICEVSTGFFSLALYVSVCSALLLALSTLELAQVSQCSADLKGSC